MTTLSEAEYTAFCDRVLVIIDHVTNHDLAQTQAAIQALNGDEIEMFEVVLLRATTHVLVEKKRRHERSLLG